MSTPRRIPIPWYDLRDGESINECHDRRLLQMPMLTGVQLEVLRQLRMTVWDGNIISKSARDWLVSNGYAVRCNGWQVITREGMAILDTLGEMRDERWPRKKG